MCEEFWQRKPEMFEGILERRSIRKYQDKQISDTDIQNILLAGQYASNASNLQTWEFIAVTKTELIKDLASLVDNTYQDMAKLIDDKDAKKHIKYARFYATFFGEAPLVVFVASKPYESLSDKYYAMMGVEGASYRENRKRANSGLQSCAAAIQNMLLAAWSMGIGGVWMTAPMVTREAIEKVLDVKDSEIVAVVPFGYPSEPPKEPNRKPLDEVVRYYR